MTPNKKYLILSGITLTSIFVTSAAVSASSILNIDTAAKISGYPFSITEGYKSAEDQARDWVAEIASYNPSLDPSSVQLVNFDKNTLAGEFTVATQKGTTIVVQANCTKKENFNFLPFQKALQCSTSGTFSV